ncbi:MAG: alpha/beta fold hydrolase [Candidatus Heimdallarchaeota archaeon]
MPRAHANNIEIEYETFGDPSSKPLLMVMGIEAQMFYWPEEMLKTIANRGFYVIIFDNRDVGLSTKFKDADSLNATELFTKLAMGQKVEIPYKIEDMADDAVGLLDHLNIDKAHICGVSMGGMIVQIIAIRHPTRVLTLTSMMSSTGDPAFYPTPEFQQKAYVPIPTEREANIEANINQERLRYGTLPFDEERAREYYTKAYDRSFNPKSAERHMLAVVAAGNIKSRLKSIKVPTLVIHGKEDLLVPKEGGIDVADAIPGAELLLIDGMGHSLPPEVVPQIIDAIIANANKVS